MVYLDSFFDLHVYDLWLIYPNSQDPIRGLYNKIEGWNWA